MPMKEKISLIVPTLNRPNDLAACLESIALCDMQPDEVVVIDQSRDSNIIERNAETCKVYSNVIYVLVDFASITKARNVGMARAKNELLVFSDDDVTFPSDFFNRISSLFDDKKLGLLGTFNALEKPLKKSCHLFSKIFNFREFREKQRGYFTKSMLGVLPPSTNEVSDTDWAMGYCFCVRKSVVQANNLQFDNCMMGYAFNEDLDFTMRYCAEAKSNGFRCEYRKDIFVYHHGSQEYRVPSLVFYAAWLGNRVYMQAKQGVKHYFYIWLTYVGLKAKLHLTKEKAAAKNLCQAYRLIKKSIKQIQSGCLDYSRMMEGEI